MSDTFSLLRFGILVRHNISRRLFGLETAILMFEKSFESIIVIGVAGCLFIDSTGVKFPVLFIQGGFGKRSQKMLS